MDPKEFQFGTASVAVIIALTGFSALGFLSLRLLRKHKKAIEGIWLTLASTILAYFAIDFLAGQILLEKLSPRIAKDESLHHKLIPGTLSAFKSREFNYIQRVNDLGLRGKDIQTDKEEGTYRILMLGDSFTMGKGVGDKETYSVLLEESLNAAGWQVEVLNAGVDSYSPILSYRQLITQFGPLLEPDLVVLNFDMSDLMQEVAYREAAIIDNNGEIVGFRVIAEGEWTMAPVKRFVASNLYFTSLLYAYLERSTSNGADDITVENTVNLASPHLLKHTLAGDKTDRRKQWQNIFASILNIRNYCDKRDIEFLLTTYPWGHQVNKEEWVPGRYNFIKPEVSVSDKSIVGLESFANDNSINFLNVFPAFRSYDGSSPLYFDFDMHWTSSGHEIMAGELERIIPRKFLGEHKLSRRPHATGGN